MTPAAVTATVLGYIAVLFAVAWASGRRADNAGFFTGNRRNGIRHTDAPRGTWRLSP